MSEKTATMQCPHCKKNTNVTIVNMNPKNRQAGINQYKCGACQRLWQVNVGGSVGRVLGDSTTGAIAL